MRNTKTTASTPVEDSDSDDADVDADADGSDEVDEATPPPPPVKRVSARKSSTKAPVKAKPRVSILSS